MERGLQTPQEFRLSEGIQTTSRLRRWWLTFARGYRLTTTRRTPQSGLFGSIYYRTLYILERKEDGE